MILPLKQGILGAPREKRGAMVARCVRLLFRVAGRGSGCADVCVRYCTIVPIWRRVCRGKVQSKRKVCFDTT